MLYISDFLNLHILNLYILKIFIYFYTNFFLYYRLIFLSINRVIYMYIYTYFQVFFKFQVTPKFEGNTENIDLFYFFTRYKADRLCIYNVIRSVVESACSMKSGLRENCFFWLLLLSVSLSHSGRPSPIAFSHLPLNHGSYLWEVRKASALPWFVKQRPVDWNSFIAAQLLLSRESSTLFFLLQR